MDTTVAIQRVRSRESRRHRRPSRSDPVDDVHESQHQTYRSIVLTPKRWFHDWHIDDEAHHTISAVNAMVPPPVRKHRHGSTSSHHSRHTFEVPDAPLPQYYDSNSRKGSNETGNGSVLTNERRSSAQSAQSTQSRRSREERHKERHQRRARSQDGRRRSRRNDDDDAQSVRSRRRRNDDDNQSIRSRRRRKDDDDTQSIRSRRRHRDDDDNVSVRSRRRHRDDDDAQSIRSRRRQDRSEERSLRSVRSFESLRSAGRRLRRVPSGKILHGVRLPAIPATKKEGRIQTLTGAQEVTYKRLWAEILYAWGYPIDIDISDIGYSSCYVPSSSTMNRDNYVLVRSVTRASGKSTKSTKSGFSLFRSRTKDDSLRQVNTQRSGSPPPNSRRMNEIMYSRHRYEPIVCPTDPVINAYVNVFKLSYEFANDYIPSDNEDNDPSDDEELHFEVASFDSFKTAQSEPKPRVTTRTPPTSSSSMRVPLIGEDFKVYKYGDVPKARMVQHPESNPDLQRYPPIVFQKQWLAACRNDLPDNFILRFVRARKWDVDKSIKMLSESIAWRLENPANDWLFEGDGPSYLQGRNQGMIRNFTREKSWVSGVDREGCPIFWFQARKHFGSDSPAPETERYAVLQIEWVRLFLQEVSDGVDNCSIVFDLTGFTLKNADYSAIKFLAVVFEAHYPDCLGRVVIYNAPWIFSTVWNIIKHWFDPVVAAKIHFAKNYQELKEHIDPIHIPTEYGGKSVSAPEYPVPMPGDDRPPLKKDAEYRRLRLERDWLIMKFLTASVKWVEAIDPDESERYLQEKIALNIAISENYCKLDPYIRCRGIYDRNGTLKVRS
ncbi:hypothetical protein DIURU_004556 [Diutina rugosa]|uniref:CRAL-TRIO domain-containing protein n=1 Tax=Diutina rugosa TaxID=5481 RepID=A0A642UGY9_DIURU|nr:uncharacterized protein DIURU_004556 [Diutina rugosa]KAA8898712.1 hypothetical protein DIURU_004556 [Diutina rugosa]